MLYVGTLFTGSHETGKWGLQLLLRIGACTRLQVIQIMERTGSLQTLLAGSGRPPTVVAAIPLLNLLAQSA